MIDNFEQAVELMEDMKADLPIPVRPRPELLQTLKSRSSRLPAEGEWRIASVFYAGDAGGILCGISLPEGSTEAVVVSLTHLRVDYGHPLSQRLREYQSRRAKKLARLNSDARPKPVTVKPKSTPTARKRKRRR